MPELRIGCSGFSYQHWKGVFYPDDLAQRKWLEYYSSVFQTVELNVTFYRLPRSTTFDTWHQQVPSDFVFSLKGSRFITHVKKLSAPGESLKLYFERALRLKEKLAVVLWQFPPSFKMNHDRLAAFLSLLRHYPARHTFEFRHESWIAPNIVDLCRMHNAGLCMADWPAFIDDLPITADFVYMRRHGHGGSYATRYSMAELRKDAARIRTYLKSDKSVFIYFNNDARGYAPENAQQLQELLQ
jgi:uncharacterized protein YecE (DUF72 family)